MKHTAAELKTNNDFLFLGDWNTRPSTGTPVRGYATNHMISSFSQLCVYIPATADSCGGRGEGFKLFSTQSVSVKEQLLWQYSEHHLAYVLLNMLSKNLTHGGNDSGKGERCENRILEVDIWVFNQ